jgi:hypothetical protein
MRRGAATTTRDFFKKIYFLFISEIILYMDFRIYKNSTRRHGWTIGSCRPRLGKLVHTSTISVHATGEQIINDK